MATCQCGKCDRNVIVTWRTVCRHRRRPPGLVESKDELPGDFDGDDQHGAMIEPVTSVEVRRVEPPSDDSPGADSSSEIDADNVAFRFTCAILQAHAENFMTQKATSDYLRIVSRMLGPHLPTSLEITLPKTYGDAVKRIEALLIDHVPIACCVNGCELFYGSRTYADACSYCDEARLDEKTGQPRQLFYYLPIISRLRRLFRDPVLSVLIRHPTRHQYDPDYITDVYDTPIWRDYFMPNCGYASDANIAFALNMDGIRITEAPVKDVWPITLSILNLPPWIRNKISTQWISGIIPTRHDRPWVFLGMHFVCAMSTSSE